MIRRAAYMLAATLLASSLATAQARDSAWVGTRNDTIPVTFSFSGAISMGVYQAGVNWALSQFINLTQDSPGDENQGLLYRSLKELPRIDVAALSGASAGNINALLAAIEYCDTRPVSRRPPESSLFWQMWVLSGWDELMPRHGVLGEDDDPGIFSRTRLAGYIENKLITEALKERAHRPGCRIPVGIIVTRVDPLTEQSAGGLEVQTQRFLVPFEMREERGQLHFFQPIDSVFQDASLGSMIAVGDPRGSLIDPADIFKVVEASSSYPVAFAPVYFPYWYFNPACRPRPLAECWQHDAASFMDGGVFDVLPLSTGMGLYRAYSRERARKNGGTGTDIAKPRLLFVDVGLARDRLKDERLPETPDSKPAATKGLDAIVRFLAGFVPTARQYERSVFGRTADPSAWYISTARGLPAVSEHLGYFAGFFGRPFREVDFYAGVGDGLYYISREILCEPSRDPARRPFPDSARRAAEWDLQRRECTARELTELATQHLNIDDTGLHILNHLLSQGKPSFTILPAGTVAANPEKVATLKAIADAEISLLGPQDPKCKVQGLVTLALCTDRFRVFLDKLDADTVVDVPAVFRRWASSQSCTGNDDPSRAHCWAERDLAKLVEEPELQIHAYLGSALRRLRSVEERGEQTLPKAVTRIAEAAYRSTDYRYRRGVELDPSSIPPYEKLAGWGALAVMPYYAGATVGTPGWKVGWQPTWHTPLTAAPWLAIGLPLELIQTSDLSTKPKSHFYVAATPSLIWRKTSLMNQIQVGARLAVCAEGNCLSTRRWGPEITAHFLSKLRVSLYQHVSGTNGKRKFAGSVSVADLNGMMYWALRR